MRGSCMFRGRLWCHALRRFGKVGAEAEAVVVVGGGWIEERVWGVRCWVARVEVRGWELGALWRAVGSIIKFCRLMEGGEGLIE